MGLFAPRRCQICTTPFRRGYYTWQTSQHGTVYVCPKCNTRLENMKSREAFDPSKPFVFPPIVKSSGASPGCGCLLIGIVAIGLIAALGSHNQSVLPPALPPPPPSTSSTTAPPEQITPSLPKPEARETPAAVTPAPSSEPANVTQQAGPSVALKDVSTFPVTVRVTQRIEVKTDSGGFGIDPGDEVLVLRKQGGTYIISHENQEFSIDTSILDNMQTK